MLTLTFNYQKAPKETSSKNKIEWNEFFGKKLTPAAIKEMIAETMVAGLLLASAPKVALAGVVADRITNSMWPLIDLVQGLVYPVAFFMLVYAGLLVMIGQRSKGMTAAKSAAIGFILVQFVPGIMAALSSAGSAMVGK